MILAFGCSIAHGCELAHPYQHEENTLLSYPQLVADHLGTSCINYSLCGISNEGIFHLLQEKVAQYKDVDTIIVGWTASMREYWRANGRHWFVIPSWTATLEDVGSKPTHVKDYSEKGVKESYDKGIDINDNPRIVTDDEQYLDELETNYKFTIKNKFDDYEYQLKKKHYINNVRMYATVNNIKLIETANLEPIDDVAIYTDTIGQWRDIRIAHPNKLEHEIIAKQIIEQYYGR